MDKQIFKYFRNSYSQARELLSDRERLSNTLDRAFKKVVNIEGEDSEIQRVVNKVKLFIRMIRSYIEGEYREVPWKTIVIMVAGLIYFINPLDLVPDFIPGLGYLDDITIILWIFKSVEDDILHYQEYTYNSR